jgi:hypothetical protein
VAIRRGPLENGVLRPARATLECAGRPRVEGIQICEGESVAEYQEEGAEKMDSGYVGESLRVSERDRRRMGRPERWPVPRKVQRRGGPEGRTAPGELPECERAEGAGVPNAHLQSGETQDDLLDNG